MKIDDLIDSLNALKLRYPTSTLMKNQVGNISAILENGEYVAYIDLHDGELNFVGEW